MSFDLIIRNGRVVDGTGLKAYAADLAIDFDFGISWSSQFEFTYMSTMSCRPINKFTAL